MRSEGDIANLITSATIWRRIGILGEETSGIVLMGHANDAETTELQRSLSATTIRTGSSRRALRKSHCPTMTYPIMNQRCQQSSSLMAAPCIGPSTD